MEFFIDLSSYIKLSEYGEAIPNENLISSNIAIKWAITKSSSNFQKKENNADKKYESDKIIQPKVLYRSNIKWTYKWFSISILFWINSLYSYRNVDLHFFLH